MDSGGPVTPTLTGPVRQWQAHNDIMWIKQESQSHGNITAPVGWMLSTSLILRLLTLVPVTSLLRRIDHLQSSSQHTMRY